MNASRPFSFLLVPIVLPLLLAACAGERIIRAPVVPDTLHAVAERISDEAIRADRQVIEALRTRLRRLNESGNWPMDDYHVCKAIAWVDFAETEYTDNDRGGVVEAALSQARDLIAAMEMGADDISTETALLPQSMVIRHDLWAFTVRAKTAGDGGCLDCNLARLEVQLIAAGHDHRELGWRHAASGVMAAERYRRAVEPALAACERTPEAEAQVCDAALLVSAMVLPEVVHFAYDQSTLSNETAAVLAQVAQFMFVHREVRVELVGHTDVRGSDRYNDALGERRARAVRAYLLASGVDPARVDLASQGRRQSLQVEAERLRAHAMDRRVELIYTQLPDIDTRRQLIDLQPDR